MRQCDWARRERRLYLWCPSAPVLCKLRAKPSKKVRNKAVREIENEKQKHKDGLDAIQKEVDKHNAKKGNLDERASKDTDRENAMSRLQGVVPCPQEKDDGPLSSKADKLKTCTKRMEWRDLLTTKEHLIDLGHEEELVNLVLEGKDNEDSFQEDVGDVGSADEPHNGGMIRLFAGIIWDWS